MEAKFLTNVGEKEYFILRLQLKVMVILCHLDLTFLPMILIIGGLYQFSLDPKSFKKKKILYLSMNTEQSWKNYILQIKL